MAGTEVLGQMVHGQGPPAELVTRMVNEAVAICWGLLASAAWAVKLYEPAVVGVPAIPPVVVLRDSPGGNDPLRIDHV
jgi:hypothetical protein